MDKPGKNLQTPQPTLFYDGECGFCNGSVQFVLNHEKAPVLSFAPLQGETAAETLPHSDLPPDIGQGTVVLYDNDHFFVRSRAALRTMAYMGGIFKILSRAFAIVPAPLADAVYNLIARNRKRIPVKTSCELLPPEKRKRFLP